MNGSIRVFNTASGVLAGTLENEDTVSEAMPISRIRCKPGYTAETANTNLLAATYVSGHLRIWNYSNGHCVSQVMLILSQLYSETLGLLNNFKHHVLFRFKMKTKMPSTCV